MRVVAVLGWILFCAVSLQAKSITVMSYNVENLFDTEHDKGKHDYAYLPVAVKRDMPEAMAHCKTVRVPIYRDECFNQDWTEEVLNVKVNNISRVIKSFDDGKLPDILVLQEVENLNVLNILNTKGKLGYKSLVLVEGADSRGIDVAIMSKFPVAGEPKIHYVDSNQKVKTRGILEAKFNVDGKEVAVFANHWPSQANPDELRVLAAKTLMAALSKSRADVRVAAGDFNTTDKDSPHGINEEVLRPKRGLYFVETNPAFFDAKGSSGSHWYKGKWQYLDRIFVDSKSVSNGVRYEFELFYQDFMLTDRQYRQGNHTETHSVPFRFNAKRKEGFADHLPVAVKLHL